MSIVKEVNGLLDRFTTELLDTCRIVVTNITSNEGAQANMGSRAIRLAAAEHVAGVDVKPTEGIPKDADKLLKKVRSVFSMARRAVKIAESKGDAVIFAWLDGEASAPSMWKYLADNKPAPDPDAKLKAAMKIVTQYFMIEEPEALERFVARIELDREALSNTAQKLLDSLNHQG